MKSLFQVPEVVQVPGKLSLSLSACPKPEGVKSTEGCSLLEEVLLDKLESFYGLVLKI